MDIYEIISGWGDQSFGKGHHKELSQVNGTRNYTKVFVAYEDLFYGIMEKILKSVE